MNLIISRPSTRIYSANCVSDFLNSRLEIPENPIFANGFGQKVHKGPYNLIFLPTINLRRDHNGFHVSDNTGEINIIKGEFLLQVVLFTDPNVLNQYQVEDGPQRVVLDYERTNDITRFRYSKKNNSTEFAPVDRLENLAMQFA